MILGKNTKKEGQFKAKTFFFREHVIFMGIKFCRPNWVVKLSWLEKVGHGMKKFENHWCSQSIRNKKVMSETNKWLELLVIEKKKTQSQYCSYYFINIDVSSTT